MNGVGRRPAREPLLAAAGCGSVSLPRSLARRPVLWTGVGAFHRLSRLRCAEFRGATQIAANSVPAMEEAVVELCREIEQRNEIGPADIVWAIFTVTRDLDADFPARAARVAGWTQVPMICS